LIAALHGLDDLVEAFLTVDSDLRRRAILRQSNDCWEAARRRAAIRTLKGERGLDELPREHAAVDLIVLDDQDVERPLKDRRRLWLLLADLAVASAGCDLKEVAEGLR
jgi:hypothetical protein